jgi:hypothetical protein
MCEAGAVRLVYDMLQNCPKHHVALQQELAGVMCNIGMHEGQILPYTRTFDP